jgi:uncharacterized membrane protein YtjA (UPF0391 family)
MTQRLSVQPRLAGLAVHSTGSDVMLYWALIFLLVALVAGGFGFGGIASASAGIAKILFFNFLLLFIAGLVMHMMRGRTP